MLVDALFLDLLESPVRSIGGRVELYKGSSLRRTFTNQDFLKSFEIQRVGDNSKFFGFGICQRLNVHLLDIARAINITTANNFKISYTKDSNKLYPYPNFYVSEVHRDEVTNELSITAYDAIYKAAEHTVDELELTTPYTIKGFVVACAGLLGVNHLIPDLAAFNTSYDTGANFEGTETIRAALDAVAEVTQTIYYLNSSGQLTFKRLDVSGNPVYTVNKENYFTLDSENNRRLIAVCHATELGDNVIASAGGTGTTQYIRDNPFWEMREDIAQLVRDALAAVNGLTINQFTCSWRGNFLLEIGDKIAFTTKDNKTAVSFLLDDVITYNGGLSASTQWSYTDNEAESADNPVSLGDALTQTFAKVDKANKEIKLVASEASSNASSISALLLNTESISATVKALDGSTADRIESLENSVSTLESELKQSAESLEIFIREIEENGIEKVTTETGFSFDNEGLTISKSGKEMTTQITEDGMTVSRSDTPMLTANNSGVVAQNLHASTYLTIGANSRFEDYEINGTARTACFWIGG